MQSVFQLMFSLENLPSYINLIVIKHYNLESKIQSLLPTQGIILACLAFCCSTTKFSTNERCISNTKIHKHVVQSQFVQLSKQYVFFCIFCVAGKHLGGKPSMQVEYASHICNIFPV